MTNEPKDPRTKPSITADYLKATHDIDDFPYVAFVLARVRSAAHLRDSPEPPRCPTSDAQPRAVEPSTIKPPLITRSQYVRQFCEASYQRELRAMEREEEWTTSPGPCAFCDRQVPAPREMVEGRGYIDDDTSAMALWCGLCPLPSDGRVKDALSKLPLFDQETP